MQMHREGVEAFIRFLEFETRFDRVFKISIAALTHVKRVVSGTGGLVVIRGLIADTEMGWRDDDGWRNPQLLMSHAASDLSQLAIVQLHSAIDDFVVHMEADVSRWTSRSSGLTSAIPTTFQMDEERDERRVEPLEILCIRHGWNCDAFEVLRPVLLFFRAARNCIAHRGGVASLALAEIRNSQALDEALQKWVPVGKGPHPLPQIEAGQVINFEPRHVVAAVEALHRATRHVNDQAVKAFGEAGLVFMAAYYGLLADDPMQSGNSYITPAAVVNYFLAGRYRIRDSGPVSTVKALRSIGIWQDCIKRHEQLFGRPPAIRFSERK